MSDTTMPAGLHRRQFLALLSAVAAAPCVGPLARSAWAAAEAAEPMRLGYLLGSDQIVQHPELLRRLNDPVEPLADTLRAAIPEELPLTIVDVASLPTEAFDYPTGRATVVVHGVLPPRHVQPVLDVGDASLEVDFFPPDGSAPYPYYAWRLHHGPGGRPSGPTRFTITVGSAEIIGLRLAVAPALAWATSKEGGGAPVQAGRPAARHTTATLGERPVLRPGLYLLPLTPAAASALPMPATYDYLVREDLPYLALSVIPEATPGS